MTTVIAYRSRHGATAQYARWLGEEMAITVKRLDKLDPQDLAQIQTLIIGSNVRIGRIEAGKWLDRHWPQIASKKIILFSVSLTSPDDEEIAAIYERSVPGPVRDQITYLALPGRFRPRDLPFLERLILHFAPSNREWVGLPDRNTGGVKLRGQLGNIV